MDIILQLTIMMTLMIIGLLMAANNFFHSLMIKHLFFNDKISHFLTRIFGVIVIVTSIVFIMGFEQYAVFTLIITFFGIVFLTVRGRSIRKVEYEKKRQELLKDHEAMLQEKREKLERLRVKIKESDQNAQAKSKSKTVEQMKKDAWNDGSLTNKELRDKLKSHER